MQGNRTLVLAEARTLQRALFREIAKDAGYSLPASKYTCVSYVKVDYIAAFLAADPAKQQHSDGSQRPQRRGCAELTERAAHSCTVVSGIIPC